MIRTLKNFATSIIDEKNLPTACVARPFDTVRVDRAAVSKNIEGLEKLAHENKVGRVKPFDLLVNLKYLYR